MISSIITPAGANIHIPGVGMKKIAASSPVYAAVIAVLSDNPDDPEIAKLDDNEKIHRILRLIDREAPLRESANGLFEVVNGNIKIEGEFVPEIISKRIFEFMEKKYDYAPIANFWKRLVNNPSERSRSELMAFLEKNGIPISTDGCFVAYKYVSDDFGASHDPTYKNHPGNELFKDRKDCDPDSSRTCSYGLHVASWDYVKGNRTIVAVKVDPVDVVSIPYDYNGTKMRVCRYRVIETITGEFNEPRYDLPAEELDRNEFEHFTVKGKHTSNGKGVWSGVVIHKHPLLNGLTYKGDSLPLLYKDFISVVDEVIKDTRFNYLRQRRNSAGGFLKGGN